MCVNRTENRTYDLIGLLSSTNQQVHILFCRFEVKEKSLMHIHMEMLFSFVLYDCS